MRSDSARENFPSNIARFAIDQMRRTGFVLRGEIGVEAQTVTPGLAPALGLARDTGVILADVVPGGPGDTAGLKIGDIVLSLNGKPMENARQFHVNLYRQSVSSIVTLQVLRGADTLEKKVVLLARSNSPERFASQVNERQDLVPRLSILALPIDAKIAGFLMGSPRRAYGILVARLAITTNPRNVFDRRSRQNWSLGYSPRLPNSSSGGAQRLRCWRSRRIPTRTTAISRRRWPSFSRTIRHTPALAEKNRYWY
jgi:hypothetical protein